MARKQKLVHLHSTANKLTIDAATTADMAVGEIAVYNAAAADEVELYALNGAGTAVATFATKAYIDAEVKKAMDDATQAEEAAAQALADAKKYADDQDAAQTVVLKKYTDDAVAAEAALREAADTKEVSDRNKAIEDAVAAEAALREAADATEKAAREAADTQLRTDFEAADAVLTKAVEDEATARDEEDKKLAQDILDEKAAREGADTQLRTDFEAADATEKAAREAADATLTQAVADEATARQAADKALDDAIVALTGEVEKNEETVAEALNDLNTRVIVLEAIDHEGLVADGVAEAKAYTDEREVEIDKKWAAADATTLTTAKAYTDEREVEIDKKWTAADLTLKNSVDAAMSAETAVRVARENAIEKGYQDADSAITEAYKAADEVVIEYVDGLIAAEVERSDKYADDAVAAEAALREEAISGVTKDLNDHVGDADVHIQDGERTRWTEAAAAIEAFLGEADATVALDQLVELQSWIDTHEGAATNMSNAIAANTKAIADEKAAREAADSAITEAYEAADTQIRTDFAAADTQIRTDFAAADTQIRTDFAAADKALGDRLAVVEGWESTLNSAVQSVVVENSTNNKITATKEGTQVTFNFDEMVIDCGEY